MIVQARPAQRDPVGSSGGFYYYDNDNNNNDNDNNTDNNISYCNTNSNKIKFGLRPQPARQSRAGRQCWRTPPARRAPADGDRGQTSGLKYDGAPPVRLRQVQYLSPAPPKQNIRRRLHTSHTWHWLF